MSGLIVVIGCRLHPTKSHLSSLRLPHKILSFRFLLRYIDSGAIEPEGGVDHRPQEQ